VRVPMFLLIQWSLRPPIQRWNSSLISDWGRKQVGAFIFIIMLFWAFTESGSSMFLCFRIYFLLCLWASTMKVENGIIISIRWKCLEEACRKLMMRVGFAHKIAVALSRSLVSLISLFFLFIFLLLLPCDGGAVSFRHVSKVKTTHFTCLFWLAVHLIFGYIYAWL